MYKTGYKLPDWVVPAATQGSIGIGPASNDLYYAVLLKAIAPFVCAHPHCAAWTYGRGQGRPFNTGAYGAVVGGVMFKRLYLC